MYLVVPNFLNMKITKTLVTGTVWGSVKSERTAAASGWVTWGLGLVQQTQPGHLAPLLPASCLQAYGGRGDWESQFEGIDPLFLLEFENR